MHNTEQERRDVFDAFLKQNNYAINDIQPLRGDASRRRFFRHSKNDKSVIIIDADPNLGEEPSAYAAVTYLLEKHKFSVPKIHASDIDNGFFIVEDFGDNLYSHIINKNSDSAETLYKNALDALIELQKIKIDSVLSYGEGTYKLHDYDINRYISEVKIFTDWYFPEVTKRPTPAIAKDELNTIMRGLLMPVITQSSGLVLRDYHAENLMLLDNRTGIAKVGMLDYQDAVIGSHAYDVVSLLQDARRDITPDFEQKMLDYYLNKSQKSDTHSFMRDYYILGSQRNIKILGIFTRLWLRDRKTQYLPHIDRVWQYLDIDLEQPQLKPLKDWFFRWLPHSLRQDKFIA
jgi:aminoglycoside/choline kinase family phosphotransferase